MRLSRGGSSAPVLEDRLQVEKAGAGAVAKIDLMLFAVDHHIVLAELVRPVVGGRVRRVEIVEGLAASVDDGQPAVLSIRRRRELRCRRQGEKKISPKTHTRAPRQINTD